MGRRLISRLTWDPQELYWEVWVQAWKVFTCHVFSIL